MSYFYTSFYVSISVSSPQVGSNQLGSFKRVDLVGYFLMRLMLKVHDVLTPSSCRDRICRFWSTNVLKSVWTDKPVCHDSSTIHKQTNPNFGQTMTISFRPATRQFQLQHARCKGVEPSCGWVFLLPALGGATYVNFILYWSCRWYCLNPWCFWSFPSGKARHAFRCPSQFQNIQKHAEVQLFIYRN